MRATSSPRLTTSDGPKIRLLREQKLVWLKRGALLWPAAMIVLVAISLLLQEVAALEGLSVSYLSSLPTKKILIWGADEAEGTEMAKFVHSRCSFLLMVGSDAQATEAAVEEVKSLPPTTGTCPPGVDPVVDWDVGSIQNSSYVLQLTSRCAVVLVTIMGRLLRLKAHYQSQLWQTCRGS
eukprot:Skav230625  [mRNA]  locus=scaffold1673:133322:136608:+ [translate_table: standard]